MLWSRSHAWWREREGSIGRYVQRKLTRSKVRGDIGEILNFEVLAPPDYVTWTIAPPLLDKIYNRELAKVGYLAARGSPGCSQGVLLGGHHAVGKSNPKASRCSYFIKCCNCKEVVAGRDFAIHTGVHKSNDWRTTLRVLDNDCNTRLKDWVRDRSNAVSTGYPSIGTRLCVFWPTDQNWFAGCLTAYDAQDGLSKIEYDDGDEEWLYLAMECFMITPAEANQQSTSHSQLVTVDNADPCSSASAAEQEPRQAAALPMSHANTALVVKQEHPGSDCAILVEREPFFIKCEPATPQSMPHPSPQPQHAKAQRPASQRDAQPARPPHDPSSSTPTNSAVRHSWPEPQRKRQKTSEAHQPKQPPSHRPSPKAKPQSAASAHPPAAPQSMPAAFMPPTFHTQQPTEKEAATSMTARQRSTPSLQSVNTSMQHPTPLLQGQNMATLLQQHTDPSLADSRDTAAPNQQTQQARLQLALLPGSSSDAAADACQVQRQGNSKVLQLLQAKFAPGCKLGTDARQEALQDLVSLVTDPMTTASFFAVLDRQSRFEVQHSLERWHKRIAQMFQVHRTEASTEVEAILQTYLKTPCS